MSKGPLGKVRQESVQACCDVGTPFRKEMF